MTAKITRLETAKVIRLADVRREREWERKELDRLRAGETTICGWRPGREPDGDPAA